METVNVLFAEKGLTYKIVIMGGDGRMHASIDSIGVVTFADDLTLDEAKDAIRFTLEELVKGIK